jgi:phage shock protein PspC (stress-responsive transcriptional regulator)
MDDTAPTITIPEPPPVRRLTRSRDGRWFAGVCSGLGRYFDISPTIYRLAFVALALAGGTGVLLYVAAWVVIPDEGRETSIAEQALRDRRDRPGLAIGVGLLGLGAILLFSHAALWPHPGNLWLAALLVGGGLVWWELHGRQPVSAAVTTAGPGGGGTTAATAPGIVAPRPRRPSLFLPVVGGLLAVAGALGLLQALDWVDVDWRLALGAAVALVGVAIVAGAVARMRVAGLVGLGLLLLPLLVVSLAIHVPLRGGIGDRSSRPVLASAVPSHYRLAIGHLEVDLHDLAVPDGGTRVRASVGIGRLLVRVPAGVGLDITGRAQAGDVVFFGTDENGVDVERHHSEGSDVRRLVLDLEVGVGQIEVQRG